MVCSGKAKRKTTRVRITLRMEEQGFIALDSLLVENCLIKKLTRDGPLKAYQRRVSLNPRSTPPSCVRRVVRTASLPWAWKRQHASGPPAFSQLWAVQFSRAWAPDR